VVISLGVAVAAFSCSQTTKFQVLNFFFDGVPEPGSQADASDSGATSEADETLADTAPARPVVVVVAHKPYRDNQCGSCHSVQTGQLVQSVRDGLCQTCHTDVPGKVRYVHGPVAVRDCLFCHHHHGSRFRPMLLTDPVSTCLKCHDREDLGQDAHADLDDDRSCTDCHGAHGGNDPFFLKRVDR
jgi:predicted CXXCH cytochrome family protein